MLLIKVRKYTVPSTRREEFVSSLHPGFSNCDVHMDPESCWNADSDPVGLGQSLRFCISSQLPGNARAFGPQSILWSRPQTNSSDGMNRAEELVWTFLRSWVISWTAVFLWKTQCSALTDMAKPHWKAPPSYTSTCENILEQAIKREKPAARHLGSPQLFNQEKAPWFQYFDAPFLEGWVLPSPHYFWKSWVADVPEAGGPQEGASQTLLDLCHCSE